METEKLITLLSIVAILLIIYRILISKEEFEQVEICDYNSPDPNQFCKSIQKGCSDLITENNNLNTNINTNCSTLPTNTRDMIDTAISCNDDVNKLIMNSYVQKEVCSQIKNFPPSETILAKPVEPVPSPTFSPIDFDDDKDKYFLTNEKGYAPF
jgi:hypothetical protein